MVAKNFVWPLFEWLVSRLYMIAHPKKIFGLKEWHKHNSVTELWVQEFYHTEMNDKVFKSS